MTFSTCFALFPGQARKSWRLLVVSSVLLGILAFLPELHAQLTTTGLRHNFDANGDQTLADGWESFVNPGQRPWNFTGNTRVGTGNETAVQTNTAIQSNLGGVAEIYGISGRLNFPRTNGDINSSRDRGTSNSYVSAGNGQDATWEFWFKPENVTADQILWEGGGSGTGSSFTVSSGGDLQWVIKNGGATDSIVQNISALNDAEYHHFVGVYNRDDPASGTGEDTMTLFIDGVQVATTLGSAPTNMHGWDGGDPASLGGRGSTVGGTNGDLGGGINGYRNLDGKVAAFRFYNAALDGADVVDNIDAVRVENVYFDGGGATDALGDQLNFDTNLVSSFNQNTHINADQSATLESGNELRTRTLFIGNDGTSELPGYTPGAGEAAPADGDGALTMNGGTITTSQIVMGYQGNVGTFDFVDGTINLNNNRAGGYTGGDPQAFHIGLSQSDGDPANDRSVFTMGTAGGGTNPRLNLSNGRFEIGENGDGSSPGTRVNATFNMESGTFTSNQNLIIGQGGIANNSSVIFNMKGGVVSTTADLNINDGTSELNISGGTLSVNDLRTQGTGGNLDTIVLSGGILEVRSDLEDRGGNTTFTINGGRLELDRPTVGGQQLREIEELNFSSGVIEFSISDPAVGLTPLRVNDAGNFTGTGQIDVEIDDRGGTAATITTWNGGNGTWTPSNQAEWDSGNPIQYINSGTAFDVLIPNSAGTTMTGLGDLSSANPDFILQVVDRAGGSSNGVQIVAVTDVGTTPIKAVIDSGGTITRNSDLLIDAAVGADAVALDINNGKLDLGSSGSDLRIGTTAVSTVTQNGGEVMVRNVFFGDGAGTRGGTLQLNGGTFAVSGDISETDSSVPEAQLHIDGSTLTVGGDITVQRFAVGNNGGTTGEFTSKNQSVLSTGTTAIGSAGNGTYTIGGNSSHTTQSNFVIGEAAGSQGLVTQLGGTLTVANNLAIGVSGTGQFDLVDGTVDVNGGGLEVSDNIGQGTFNIGTADGSTSPTVTIAGGNFEAARVGNGFVNFLSGTITQETNNLITGQNTGSVANVVIGGGPSQALYTGVGSRDWNTNSGIGNVQILSNGTVNIGRHLQAASGGGGFLNLDLNGGELNIGANDLGGDVIYRAGGGQDVIQVTNAKLTVADDFLFDDGAGQFQVNGSGSLIEVGGGYTQAAGNTLIVAPDPAGLSIIEVAGAATVAGFLDVDDSLFTGNTALPNTPTIKTGGGAWDNTDTGWDRGNPMGQSIAANEEIVVLNAVGGVTDNGLILAPTVDLLDWNLNVTATQVRLEALNPSSSAAVHAILCAGTTTTRATDLLIDASGNPSADASGLTVELNDTLQLDNGSTLTVQGGARLAGGGKIDTLSGGSTIIAAGGILDPGNTTTGLPGGASLAGSIEFDGDLTSLAGSTWNIDLVDPTLGLGVAADFVDVSGTLTLDPGVTLNFAGFRPDIGSVYTIAQYGILTGRFSGLADQAVVGGYQIDYGLGAGILPANNLITLTAVVPEPSTALALFGMILSTFFRRRRRLLAVEEQ